MGLSHPLPSSRKKKEGFLTPFGMTRCLLRNFMQARLRFGHVRRSWGWDANGRTRGRPLRFDEHFDFGAKTHTAVAIGVGFGMNQARAAVRFVGGAAGNLGGHDQSGFDGHADLEWSGSDKEKAAAGNVGGFGEMIDGGKGHSQRTEAQRDTNAKTLALSTLRIRHDWSPSRAEGDRYPEKGSLIH